MKFFSKKKMRNPMARSAFTRGINFIRRYPLSFIVGALALGSMSIPVVDQIDVYFSSNKFCASACHEMKSTVYKELQSSTHWTTSTGVRPSCADCHVSERIVPAMWDHFLGMKELIVHVSSDVSTPGNFDKNYRADSAKRVRLQMVENDSKNCRTCHDMTAIKPKRKRGQKQHADALENKTTCIACHFNLVHKEIDPSSEFIEAIERH